MKIKVFNDKKFISNFQTKSLDDPKNRNYNAPDEFRTIIVNTFNCLGSQNIDLLLYLFNNVLEVNALVTYICQKAADIPKKHIYKQGNGKEKNLGETDTIKLFKKPNHLDDSGKVFLMNCFSAFFVFGYIPINFIKPVGWDIPGEMYLLPGNQFYPIPLKHINQFGQPITGIDFRLNPIVKYRLFIDTKPFDFSPEEILFIKDSNLSFVNGSYLKGQSRLYSAIRTIEGLSYLYDTINTLIAKKGAAGVVYKKNVTGFPDSGWNPKDKENVENALYSYGTTGNMKPVAVTDKELGFLNLLLPIRDFMPIELKEHDFRLLATALMFPAVLLNDKQGAIYNNVALAQKAFYSDCLMPVVNLFWESVSEKLGLTKYNEAIVPDYSEIECLQSDKKLNAEIDNINNNIFKILWDDNLITRNEWLLNVGQSTKPDTEFNKLKNELNKPIEESVNAV